MGGPAPKPTALRELDGNASHRPLNKHEPKPQGIPVCPDWLCAEAKAEWRRLAPELARLRLLTKVDRGMFAAYCQNYARWRQAEEILNAEGLMMAGRNSPDYAHPMVAVGQKCLLAMNRAAQEFGFTPAARSRVVVLPESPKSADEDLELRLLG